MNSYLNISFFLRLFELNFMKSCLFTQIFLIIRKHTVFISSQTVTYNKKYLIYSVLWTGKSIIISCACHQDFSCNHIGWKYCSSQNISTTNLARTGNYTISASFTSVSTTVRTP